MSEFIKDNHVYNLPDAYKKQDENGQNTTNNYKILEVERVAVTNLRKNIEDIFESLDLNKAYGKTLDLYGETVGQPRGQLTDEQYIIMIKAKIMRNLSNGSYQSVLDSICATCNCEPSQVSFIETENPLEIELVALPLTVINKAGLSLETVQEMIEMLLPATVNLKTFMFTGTFEIAATIGEIDNSKGLSNVVGATQDDNNIGGYLGMLTA